MAEAKPSKTDVPTGDKPPAPEATAGEKPPAGGPEKPPPAGAAAAGPPPPPSATPSKQPMTSASAKASAARLYGVASTAFRKGSKWQKITMIIGLVEILIGLCKIIVALWLLLGNRRATVIGSVVTYETPKQIKDTMEAAGKGEIVVYPVDVKVPGGPAPKPEDKSWVIKSGYQFFFHEQDDYIDEHKKKHKVYHYDNNLPLQIMFLCAQVLHVGFSVFLVIGAIRRHYTMCNLWIGSAIFNTNCHTVTCCFIYIELWAMALNYLELVFCALVTTFLKDILVNGSGSGPNKAAVGPAAPLPPALQGPKPPTAQPSAKSVAKGGSPA